MRAWLRRAGPGSLGAKLVLLLTGVGLAGAAAITLLLAAVITPSFDGLERTAIAGHVARTEAALAEFASKAEASVKDYGDWDDSYAYMIHPTARFEQQSFSPLAMSNLGVPGMAYVGLDGHVAIARWIDLQTRAEQPAMRARLVVLVHGIALPRLLRGRSSASFYARLGPEVAAVGIAQIRRSDGTGAPRGYVLMARPITSAQLSTLLGVSARVEPAAGDDDPARRGRGTVAITVPIHGPDGHVVAATRFSVPRDVSLLGRRMLLLAVAGSTLLLLIVLMVLRRAIGRLVLAPLARVESHMQQVRVSGSIAPLAAGDRRDEIGSLGRSFDALLQQLGMLREQIEVQSFALGRSELAVAVMHNVRNALNPISTILSQGVRQAPAIDRAVLDRAVAELAGDDIPRARRRKLAAFVAAAIEAEAASREAMRGELQVGREAMVQVLEIIGQQQQQAHERPALEPVDVGEIVARNATIARYSQETSIAFSFPAGRHPALANRVILSQVVANLLGNAAEAIAATGAGGGSIAVRIVERGGEVEVRMIDDGEGFDPSAGAMLFQRGFSTREHKSGGLGLHWCANAMTAMEGGLRLVSEGRGRGATAVLTLRSADQAPVARAA